MLRGLGRVQRFERTNRGRRGLGKVREIRERTVEQIEGLTMGGDTEDVPNHRTGRLNALNGVDDV